MMYKALTQVVDIIAGLVQCSGIELEADDGEDDDRKEEEQRDVHLTMKILTMAIMTMSMMTLSMMICSEMTMMRKPRMKALLTRGPIALAMDDITT